MESVSVIVSRFPLEKYLFKAPKEPDPLDRLERLMNKGSMVPAEPISQRPEVTTQASPPASTLTKPSGVSTEEIVSYQKRELRKALLLLQNHLQQ